MDEICPYLGMIDDPKTSTIFPDNCNACYRTDPPKPVVLTHQRSICLVSDHKMCEGFTESWRNGFPASLHNKNCRKTGGLLRKWRGKLPPMWIIAGVILSFLVILGVFFAVSNLGPAPVSTLEGGITFSGVFATETELVTAARQTQTATPTMTAASTDIPEQSSTPTPNFTPTQTPGPGLSTPFGSQDFQLLVHEVREQETLTGIANQYNTTVDVLWVLNGLAFRTTQAGDPIVVCLGCTEILDLPQLQPVYLVEGKTVSDLANQYNAAIDDLRAWNGLGDGEWIAGERWVVVPFELETES